MDGHTTPKHVLYQTRNGISIYPSQTSTNFPKFDPTQSTPNKQDIDLNGKSRHQF